MLVGSSHRSFPLTNLILLYKPYSLYDDRPEERYHFPNRPYLKAMQEALQKPIIYYEPKGSGGPAGRQVYFAAARIDRIEIDPNRPDCSYAYMVDYLPFPRLVPLRRSDRLHYESKLRQPDGSTNAGLRQRAVRRIDSTDFHAILSAGSAISPQLSADGVLQDSMIDPLEGLAEHQAPYRREIPASGNRKWRDPLFRTAVLRAYRSRCAFTDLKIINGGGHAEVDAAHIRPVGHNHQGTDSVCNGLALSKTVHWMFDRGVVSVSDDYRILESPGRLPNKLRPLFRSDGMIYLPEAKMEQPHPAYLRYHRKMFENNYGRFVPLSAA